MKTNTAILFLLAAASAAAAADIPRLAIQCETSRPVGIRLDIVRGETVDLAVRISNYGSALDILGAAVTLHARTNGMAEGSSWQAAGEAGTNGIASVRLDVDAWIPPAVSNGWWTLEVVQTNSARILRAGGVLRVAGTAAASTNDPVPSVWLDGINAAITNEAALRASADAVLSTGKLDVAATATWETGPHLDWLLSVPPLSYTIITNAPWLTNAPPQSVLSVNGQTGAVSITAAGIGALTEERDLAALRIHHYGSAAIVETPTNWFTISSGTITDYDYQEGRENVVIPWEIGGETVTGIGAAAFSGTPGDAITNVIAPKTLTYVGINAFATCPDLVSVRMPSVTTLDYGAFYFCLSASAISVPSVSSIGEFAFSQCSSLQSLVFTGNAPTVGASAFEVVGAGLTVTATNPQATGWGATLSDGANEIPVVRPALHADVVYQAGEPVATTGDVAQAVAGIPVPDLSGRVAVSSGIATNLTTRGWLALPQSAATNLVLRLVSSNEHIIVQEVYQ